MLIRISYILSDDDPIFPGNPHNSMVRKTSIVQGESSNTSEIRLFTHNGTHMDAPYHFDPKGLTIDQLHSRYFFYSNPFVLNLKKEFSEHISKEDLLEQKDDLRNADILLINTGFGVFRESDPKIYISEFPSLSVDAAKLIIEDFTSIRAVGIDTVSIEDIKEGPTKGFPIHKVLLSSPERYVIIIEDMKLDNLIGKLPSKVYIFPLIVKNLEAAPVTAFAETM